jgi:hypothetical protein
MSARSAFEYMAKKCDEHAQRREGGIFRKYPEQLPSHYKRWSKKCSQKRASKATCYTDLTSALQHVPQHIPSYAHYAPQPLREPDMGVEHGSSSSARHDTVDTNVARGDNARVKQLDNNMVPPGDDGETE